MMKHSTALMGALTMALSICAKDAVAQDLGAMGMYEKWSHRQWNRNYRALHGRMGPVRKTLHKARNTVEAFDHGVKQFMGDPDYQYYTRHDRRRVGFLGPRSGDMNRYRLRRGMAHGYRTGPATMNPESMRYLNRRAPPMRNTRTGLWW